MRRFLITVTLTLAGFLAVLSQTANAAQLSGAAAVTKGAAVTPEGSIGQGGSHVVKVKKWRRFGRGSRRVFPRRRWGYRKWRRRSHYGSLVGGIVLGTIVAAAVANAYPRPPRDDLCWYWTDRWHTHGYWDYCY